MFLKGRTVDFDLNNSLSPVFTERVIAGNDENFYHIFEFFKNPLEQIRKKFLF